MNKERLSAANVDYENGIKRFAGNEALYEKYLLKFKDDVHYEAVIAVMKGNALNTFEGVVEVVGGSGGGVDTYADKRLLASCDKYVTVFGILVRHIEPF